MSKTKVILWENGSWDWEEDYIHTNNKSNLRNVVLTLGPDWSDFDVSKMVSDYYQSNLSWIFD